MSSIDGKLHLDLQAWNGVVSDDTQCMRLSPDNEIAFLSSRSANLAEYLKLHPEMAHELMVPAGFKECLVRRHERYLCSNRPLSEQDGSKEKARHEHECFDAILTGAPKVVANPDGRPAPSWREVNTFVCRNGHDTISGELMAPHYEDIATGERLRIINYGNMKIEVSTKQFDLMWEHVVCQFSAPASTVQIEFRSLHEAFRTIVSISPPWSDIKFPIGQAIIILLKQIEHRLRAVHVGRPNPCVECCPFRPATAEATLDPSFKPFLAKAEAASIVCDEVLQVQTVKNQISNAAAYDLVMREELEKRDITLPQEGWQCHTLVQPKQSKQSKQPKQTKQAQKAKQAKQAPQAGPAKQVEAKMEDTKMEDTDTEGMGEWEDIVKG